MLTAAKLEFLRKWWSACKVSDWYRVASPCQCPHFITPVFCLPQAFFVWGREGLRGLSPSLLLPEGCTSGKWSWASHQGTCWRAGDKGQKLKQGDSGWTRVGLFLQEDSQAAKQISPGGYVVSIIFFFWIKVDKKVWVTWTGLAESALSWRLELLKSLTTWIIQWFYGNLLSFFRWQSMSLLEADNLLSKDSRCRY